MRRPRRATLASVLRRERELRLGQTTSGSNILEIEAQRGIYGAAEKRTSMPQ
jgi:hypothetical protein